MRADDTAAGAVPGGACGEAEDAMKNLFYVLFGLLVGAFRLVYTELFLMELPFYAYCLLLALLFFVLLFFGPLPKTVIPFLILFSVSCVAHFVFCVIWGPHTMKALLNVGEFAGALLLTLEFIGFGIGSILGLLAAFIGRKLQSSKKHK